MKFEAGQKYRNSRGQKLEILAADEVYAGEYTVEVIAFRYVDEGVVWIRDATNTEGWILIVPLKVGDRIRRKMGLDSTLRTVTYVSEHRVNWTVTDRDGEFMGEESASRPYFDHGFERVPE